MWGDEKIAEKVAEKNVYIPSIGSPCAIGIIGHHICTIEVDTIPDLVTKQVCPYHYRYRVYSYRYNVR